MPQRPFFAQDPSARVGKVDPRIVALLSRDDQELAELQAGERTQLAKRSARIKDLESAIASTSDAAERKRLEREHSRLRRARISPLSTGICLPNDATPGRDRWIRREQLHLSALIRFDGTDEELAVHDVVVRGRIGDVVSAWIPVDELRELVARRSVRAVELARALQPELADAVGATYSNAVALHPTETGAGVLIGIVDDALDLHHPEFRNSDGTTRVLKLFDHLAGKEYDEGLINHELLDPEGTSPIYSLVPHQPGSRDHGTAVAGCAAGNGSGIASSPQPGPTPGPGFAPGASLAFVAYAPPFPEGAFGESADIVSGIDELFSFADAKGLPCVVNLSLGDDLGPHDGTTLIERAIDQALLWPGRVVTVSAGNSHDYHPHVCSEVDDGATVAFELEYSQGSGALGPVDPSVSDAIEIWYDPPGELELTVVVPADVGAGLGTTTTIGPISPSSASAAVPPSTTLLANGVKVVVVSHLDDPRNDDHVIRIEIVVPGGGRVPLGTWQLQLKATAGPVSAVDAWVDRNNSGLAKWVSPAVLDETTLGCPASAASAITVGSHARVTPSGLYPSTFSGRGPTRDGAAKPELAALGEHVSVPLAQTRTAKGAVGWYHSVDVSGTSFAAPMAAGAAALLFGCRGSDATWIDIRDALVGSALDLPPGGVDLESGAGALRLDGACGTTAKKVDVWLRDDTADPGLEPFSGPVFWRSPDVELVDANGDPLGNNPWHDPNAPWTTVVRVTVRNRGSQASGPTTVHLYWADPGTNLPFPGAWHAQGFFVGAGFALPGNAVQVDALPPGGHATVEFAWSPPAPGGNLAGDDHYCLLVRAENAADPSFVQPGGFESIRSRNNLALFNVHVWVVAPMRAMAPGPDREREREREREERRREFVSRFLVAGSAGVDGLRVVAHGFEGEVDLVLPFACLPWREASRLDRVGPRPPFGRRREDPLGDLSVRLEGQDVERRTGARGARQLVVDDGVAVLTLAGRTLTLPALAIGRRARVPAAIRVRGAQVGAKSGWIDVCQFSDGGRLGGVSIELRPGGREA